MEQALAADNDDDARLHWQIRETDADDAVWLDFDAPGCRRSFILGDNHLVHMAFAETLAGIHYGEAPEGVQPVWAELPWRLEAPLSCRAHLLWRGEGPAEDVYLGDFNVTSGAFDEWLLRADAGGR